MKVLVFTPLNPNYPRLWGRTVQSIFRLEWDGPLDWWFTTNETDFDESYRNIAHNYNRARERVLDGGYDALLTVESDMIVPADALQKLAGVDADVVYGLYVWRHSRREWSAFLKLDWERGLSLSKTPDLARKYFGRAVPTVGVGLGCTLIHRRVLDRISFRLDEERPQRVSCDWLLAYDCQKQGFQQAHHLGVVCGHQTTYPDPHIVWPDVSAPTLYGIEWFDPPEGVETDRVYPVALEETLADGVPLSERKDHA